MLPGAHRHAYAIDLLTGYAIIVVECQKTTVGVFSSQHKGFTIDADKAGLRGGVMSAGKNKQGDVLV